MRVSYAPLIVATLMLGACQKAASPIPPTDIPAVPPLEESSSAESAAAFNRTSVAIDPAQSALTFVGKSNIVNHDGSFKTFDLTMTLNEQTPSDLTKAMIDVVIDTTSVTTDSEGLTGHLQKKEFFDTANFPQATFTTTEIKKTGDTTYTLTGDLTIKGITKTVSMDAQITNDGMSLTYELPRKEFGIGNDSYGDKLLTDTVPVTATIVFAN